MKFFIILGIILLSLIFLHVVFINIYSIVKKLKKDGILEIKELDN